jgi:hemerythrin-like metal-binding protein
MRLSQRKREMQMTLLSWREDYEVGVRSIDLEHRYLFGLINAFHDQYAGGRTRAELSAVLTRLVAYAESHFQHEEALMRESGYPRLALQQKAHEKLYASIYALNEKLSHDTAKVTAATLRFLKSWMLGHIINEDMEIGDFLRRKAVLAEKAVRQKSGKKAENTVESRARSEQANSDGAAVQ